MFDTINDQTILKQALQIYENRLIDSLPSNNQIETITFSSNFEMKIKKLNGMQKKPYYFMINTVTKRVASIVVILFVVLTTTVFSVKALREPVINFLIEIYDKFSVIVFDKSTINLTSSKVSFITYGPIYIPEDFSLNSEEHLNLSYYREYIGPDGKTITYEQSSLANTQVNIDTENTSTQEIVINQYTGIFFENKGFGNIIWSDGTYSFTISGNVEKFELTKIAESIQKIE